VPAPIRIGLVGYGLGGRYFHAPLLASAPDCEFLGVVTTSPERRRQVAADLARPAFASLQELASAGADVDRTNDVAASVMNHALAEEGELARGRLDEIAAPTLVIHGTADPLFPYGHAEALASGIPRAELLPLEGVGHQMPPRPWWTSVIAAMLRHTSG